MDIETMQLAPSPGFPNSSLPVLVFRGALDLRHERDEEAVCERAFDGQGWRGIWQNGIFDFHHFHAEAHEALACARGSVTVRLGGPAGQDVTLVAGDIALLPAGTSHCNTGHSDDYRIVGAYPPGQQPDMRYGDVADEKEAIRLIADVSRPATAPVAGQDAVLRRHWRR